MNIFVRELRANVKSLLIWIVIIAALIGVGASKFSAFDGNPEMLSILDSMPPALIEAMNLNAFNLTTLQGFFGIMFVYFSLMAAMAAALWGSDIISKEERDKTIEFSLVLPVSRSQVITAKALAALVHCIAFVLITWLVSVVAAHSYQPDQAFYSFLALEMQAMFVIALIFLAIGLLLGCAMQKYKRSGGLAVSIILITYVLSIITAVQPDLANLKYLSPFEYFDAATLYRTGQLDSTYLLISLAIIVASLGIAYWTYNKRDLYI
jgi:ABC-2 type transport system permease protein